MQRNAKGPPFSSLGKNNRQSWCLHAASFVVEQEVAGTCEKLFLTNELIYKTHTAALNIELSLSEEEAQSSVVQTSHTSIEA